MAARCTKALLVSLISVSWALVPAVSAAAAPVAHTEAATGVSYSSAVLNGSINNDTTGGAYFFQYGPTGKVDLTTPVQPLAPSSSKVHVSQTITGLQAFTTYHFRLVVTGATAANTVRFTTPKIPLSVAIVAVPNPVTYGQPFTVEGTLSGTGNGKRELMLQYNPFPFASAFAQFGNALVTNSVGGFLFPVLGVTQNTQFRVSTVGTAPVASPIVTEQVAVRVTMRAHSTRRKGYARLYGTVEPAEAGALVGFQRVIPHHRTKNVGGTVVKSRSATQSVFSRVVRVHKGIYQALVKVADGSHVSASSLPILIR
ncbi:MAG TPA: hypothetical protein VMI13_09370 [Solirubrobacteraceae bacterium]|nr:hypothetical protein [Solirubrobacteraceae bacterium]